VIRTLCMFRGECENVCPGRRRGKTPSCNVDFGSCLSDSRLDMEIDRIHVAINPEHQDVIMDLPR
jgi:hypothetical protein